MKESIAQAFILNLILFFFVILVLLLFGSINYSKAFKAKNRIITILEKYGSSSVDRGGLSPHLSDKIVSEIDENLRNGGYQTTDSVTCNKEGGRIIQQYDQMKLQLNSEKRKYQYCIIEYDGPAENAKYYKVITFMHFDIPIIGGFLEFPVRGETKLIYSGVSS